jgi:hypothetical protein
MMLSLIMGGPDGKQQSEAKIQEPHREAASRQQASA